MKKIAIVLMAIVAVGFTATQALAWGSCWGAGPGMGYRSGYDTGITDSRAYNTFTKENAKVRQELAGLEAEYAALMARENPDPQKAKKLATRIEGLRQQLHDTARDRGFTVGMNYNHNGYCPWDRW